MSIIRGIAAYKEQQEQQTDGAIADPKLSVPGITMISLERKVLFLERSLRVRGDQLTGALEKINAMQDQIDYCRLALLIMARELATQMSHQKTHRRK